VWRVEAWSKLDKDDRGTRERELKKNKQLKKKGK